MHNKGSRREERWERGGKKQWGTDKRHEEICGRERDGQGLQGKQDRHYRDFQVLARPGLSGRKAGNLKEVGLGWISGGRKDRGFGWGKIRDGGEQLY